MKKLIITFLIIVIIIVSGIFVFINVSNKTLEDENSDSSNVIKTNTFKGTIQSIDNDYAIVIPNKDEIEILSSGDQVYVKLPATLNLIVGEEITVEYDGTIMESYPLQINEISINGIKF